MAPASVLLWHSIAGEIHHSSCLVARKSATSGCESACVSFQSEGTPASPERRRRPRFYFRGLCLSRSACGSVDRQTVSARRLQCDPADDCEEEDEDCEHHDALIHRCE